MQIRRFYCPNIPETGAFISLPDSEARHALKVLRLRPGEGMLLLDGKGMLAEAELSSVEAGGREARCRILSRQLFPEPCPRFRLYVAPPHGKGFDLLLKAASELAVARISPILCRYGIAKPDEVSENWQNVLIAACKQAVNPRLPELDPPGDFQKALQIAQETSFFGAIPDSTAKPLPQINAATVGDLALWIGPEGGFAPEEEEAFRQAGCQPLTLGSCVLRVETAVPALLGMIHGLLK